MDDKFVDGEVWINHRKTSAKLSPYICQHGFWLWNRAGGFAGPHTDINIMPDQFAALISNANNGLINISMSGENLGKIDECSGYDAADVGAHSRDIKNYTLIIHRELDGTHFEFEGETGFINPVSVTPEYRNHLESRGCYIFRIWFKILDSEISNHFKSDLSLEAMTRYIDGCTKK